MLNVGLIGFGGIAKSHRLALAKLEMCKKAKLTCAFDTNLEAFTENTVDFSSVSPDYKEQIKFYTDLEEMLKKEKIDFVIITIPSFLHCDMSIKLLNAGYHVLCEKPMALNYNDCVKMISASKESGKELMIGQCLRFYPAFDYIKSVIDENKFGKVLGGFFSRVSPPPIRKNGNWFMKPELSGGCVTDLHIHDVDIIRYLFGEPEAICSRASTSLCKNDTVHTSFFYGNTPITAIGDWTFIGSKFEAKCRISFEKATITFEAGEVTIYPKEGAAPYKAELERVSGHEGEIAYFCDIIEKKTTNTKNTPLSAANTIKMIEIIRESAENSGKTIKL